MIHSPQRLLRAFALVGAMIAACSAASAAETPGPELVAQLRQGGYVLLMRHASSPLAVPDKASANPDNTKPERQLDQTGRDTAKAMGEAFKALRIPVGDVLSSPTYRAQETIRYAAFGTPKLGDQLGDGGQSMSVTPANSADWLRMQVAMKPRAGANTILVTHMPNIVAAFPADSAKLTDGEMLVFRPDGKGGAEMIARVTIGEWPALAAKSK
jgi:phosphohistidine phosphatase SixA